MDKKPKHSNKPESKQEESTEKDGQYPHRGTNDAESKPHFPLDKNYQLIDEENE